MSSICKRLWPLLAVGLVSVTGPRALGQPLDAQYLSNVREWTRRLAVEVERVQEEIVAELEGIKERTYYRLADDLLHHVRRFETSLRPGIGRDQLYRAYGEMDGRLHGLLKAIDGLGPAGKRLQRVAARMRYPDQQLHYYLSQGDTAPKQVQQVLQRQAQALHVAGQNLFTTANYALAGDGNAVGAAQALGSLSQAADQFATAVQQGANLQGIQNSFSAVTQSYQAALQGLGTLTPAQNQYLYRQLQRFDDIYGRVYERLELTGQRPRLR
jgi:hypothetical protein